ncbi:MAG: hypothetical protein CMK44_03495 [Porticoccus sp.]|nr:hypothetical protein [Porticoccus sp.]
MSTFLKLESFSSKSKIFIVTLLVFVFYFMAMSFLNSYSFYKFYTKNFKKIEYARFEKIIFELDFTQSLKKRTFVNDGNSVNLKFSAEDLLAFRQTYFTSFENNDGPISNSSIMYISDDTNRWRKAKVVFADTEQKVKVKLHGTSNGPIRKSFKNLDHIREKLHKFVDIEYIDPSTGGYAFKIKIPSKESFHSGMRRINFLSPYDDWGITQNALNRLISENNVITAYGTLRKLYINGLFIGPYLMQEQINKELLERNFQITNYAALKSNDDWNKSLNTAHAGTTDYTAFDKEQDGEPETVRVATTLLEKLFDAIKRKNIKDIYSLVDINNLAKVAAFIKLTGSVGPLYGDNTRYIFNAATGKFQFTFRLESGPSKIEATAPANFDLDKYNDVHYHKIFDLLIQDKEFVNLRNIFLSKIIASEDNLLAMIQYEHDKSSEFFSSINFPTNYIKYRYQGNLDIIKHNIKHIKKYLEYSKVYVTVHERETGDHELKILLDSYTSSSIKKFISCDGKVYTPKTPIRLNTPTYSRIDGYIIFNNINKFISPFGCIKDIKIQRDWSISNINPSNIYINYSKEVLYHDRHGLEFFGKKLLKVDLNTKKRAIKKYRISRGNYYINKDIVFPENSFVSIDPGTSIYLENNVSFFVKGTLVAEGTKELPIIVTGAKGKPFGTFAVMGSERFDDYVSLRFFHIRGGNEKIINGIYFTGQASFHRVDVEIKNSVFEDSESDDGLNIKYGNIKIKDSIFRNNIGDQVDLDFTKGDVSNNLFFINNAYKNFISSDGLDISGSNVKITNNRFENMTDKGISIGEQSVALVSKNEIKGNNIGIATKDSSDVCLENNNLRNNIIDIAGYIKKKMYGLPSIGIRNQAFKNIYILDINNKLQDKFNFQLCDNSSEVI